jgi:hypothetical protein
MIGIHIGLIRIMAGLIMEHRAPAHPFTVQAAHIRNHRTRTRNTTKHRDMPIPNIKSQEDHIKEVAMLRNRDIRVADTVARKVPVRPVDRGTHQAGPRVHTEVLLLREVEVTAASDKPLTNT